VFETLRLSNSNTKRYNKPRDRANGLAKNVAIKFVIFEERHFGECTVYSHMIFIFLLNDVRS
jgi:hypothetical protein